MAQSGGWQPPPFFVLPHDLRPDLRRLHDDAPPKTRPWFLHRDKELPFLYLADNLPGDEEVITGHPASANGVMGQGFVVLTAKRLILSMNQGGSTEVTAIPIPDVGAWRYWPNSQNEVEFLLAYGDPQHSVQMLFHGDGAWGTSVAERIREAVNVGGKYAL